MRAAQFLTFLFAGLLSKQLSFAQKDTLRVYFNTDESKFEEAARVEFDALILRGAIRDGHLIQIIGYTDEVGDRSYNRKLSQRRADGIRDYLIQSGFRDSDIQSIAAVGEQFARQAGNREGFAPDRRVDVVYERNPQAAAVPAKTKTAPDPAGAPKSATATGFRDLHKGQRLSLDNIFFYAGRHIVRPESHAALETLFEALTSQPDIRISIEGHVCCVPKADIDALDDDTNRLELSLNRAKFIYEYLRKKGIDPSRMRVEGFGHRHPIIDPERTESDANINRRVEIRVIE